MPDSGTLRLTLLVLMGVVYVIFSVRMALRVAATGRSFWKWLLITIFCTGIPAMVVLYRRPPLTGRRDEPATEDDEADDGGQPRRAGGKWGKWQRSDRAERQARDEDAPGHMRCPHCHRPVAGSDLDTAEGVAVCPHCGLPIDDSRIT